MTLAQIKYLLYQLYEERKATSKEKRGLKVGSGYDVKIDLKDLVQGVKTSDDVKGA